MIYEVAASVEFIMKNGVKDCFIKGFDTFKFENILLNRLVCVTVEHS